MAEALKDVNLLDKTLFQFVVLGAGLDFFDGPKLARGEIHHLGHPPKGPLAQQRILIYGLGS
jgi:hypothetical protein